MFVCVPFWRIHIYPRQPKTREKEEKKRRDEIGKKNTLRILKRITDPRRLYLLHTHKETPLQKPVQAVTKSFDDDALSDASVTHFSFFARMCCFFRRSVVCSAFIFSCSSDFAVCRWDHLYNARCFDEALLCSYNYIVFISIFCIDSVLYCNIKTPLFSLVY